MRTIFDQYNKASIQMSVLSFSVRKHADDLKNNLENIVIPMFCSAEISECTVGRVCVCIDLNLFVIYSRHWRAKSQTYEIAVIVGIKVEFLRCLRHIEIAVARFVNERVQNKSAEYALSGSVVHSTIHANNIWEVILCRLSITAQQN